MSYALYTLTRVQQYCNKLPTTGHEYTAAFMRHVIGITR